MHSIRRILNMIRSEAVSGPVDCEDHDRLPDTMACRDYDRQPEPSFNPSINLSETRQENLREIYISITDLIGKRKESEYKI